MADSQFELAPVEEKYRTPDKVKKKTKKSQKLSKNNTAIARLDDVFINDMDEVEISSDSLEATAVDRSRSSTVQTDIFEVDSLDKLESDKLKELEDIKSQADKLASENKRLARLISIDEKIKEEREKLRILTEEKRGKSIFSKQSDSFDLKTKNKDRVVAKESLLKSDSESPVRKFDVNDLELLLGLLRHQERTAKLESTPQVDLTNEDSVSTSSQSDSSPNKRRKHGKKNKIKSGMVERATASDNILKAKWANITASSEFSSGEIKFDDLKLHEFLFGEMEILARPKVSEKQRQTRQYLIKRIAKNLPKLGFDKAKEIYRRSLVKIEKGVVAWGDLPGIDRIESDVKFDFMALGGDDPQKSKTKSDKDLPEKIFCLDYNNGTCSFTEHHEGTFRGRKVKKYHMCKTCYSKNKSVKAHKDSDASCPFNKKE
jgi:hypothetical protein